jgi:hypothetical protein
MTVYDFEALKQQLNELEEPSLRDLAGDAWRALAGECHRALLVAAAETLHRILGVTNGTDTVVDMHQDPTQGTVQVTIDNIRFKVTVDDEGGTRLAAQVSSTSWTNIASLEELGRVLAKHSCYVVNPDGEVMEPVKVKTDGLAGGTL